MTALLLNPSTADETRNDPTIERVWRRAQRLGFARLDVVNLFALRSTDPRRLRDHADPVGPDNDAAILAACCGAELVLCGWGEHGAHRNRAAVVCRLLGRADVRMYALGVNASGAPKHPLYVGYATPPEPYTPPDGPRTVALPAVSSVLPLPSSPYMPCHESSTGRAAHRTAGGDEGRRPEVDDGGFQRARPSAVATGSV